MVNVAKRPCGAPGCRTLVDKGYCTAHEPPVKDYERFRGSAASRGYNYRWQRFREQYLSLSENVMCHLCFIKVATDIHHKQKLTLHPELKYELGNLQALCKECHSKLTQAGY
jgi:5-methylcytosine-specific restriction protein A